MIIRTQGTLQQLPDAKAAVVLVATGASGSLAQAITEWANIFVACGNAVLVFGGLVLMYNKLMKKRRDRRKEDKVDG